MARPTTVVTGAFSYTGQFAAKELLGRGHRVATLTSHPERPAWAGDVEVHPYAFDDPAALRRSLVGADTLVNTFWIRFPRNGLDYDDAVADIRILLECAREAGVRRVVHVSVSNPSPDSPFPYYKGKWQAEEAVRASGLSYAIVRPTWLYAGADILLNNVAWLLRKFPVFAMPGNGNYRVQPISGPDVGRVLADFAESEEVTTRDAAGPDVMTFADVVALTQKAIGTKRPVMHLPPSLALGLSKAAGLLVRDVVLTRYEVGGLMADLLTSKEPPLGTMRIADWLATSGADLGKHYHSELSRHFRGVDASKFQRPSV